MVSLEYANAYSEVLEILKCIPRVDYEKIDKETIELLETSRNKNYNFDYDPDKTLKEQNVSKIARTIIAILFRNYWATDIQREKILAKEKYDLDKLEKERRNQYNPDNIFKNDNRIQIEQKKNLPIEIKNETLFTKFIKLIKRIFKL